MSWSPDALLRGAPADAAALLRLDDLPVPGRALTPEQVEAERAAARADAHAEGYAAGWAEGVRAAAERARVEAERVRQEAEAATQWHAAAVARALQALDVAADELERRVAPVLDDAQAELAGAAITLAEELLGRELAHTPEPVLDAVRRALALAPVGRPVTVWVHPDDEAVLQSMLDGGAVRAHSAEARIDLVADPALEPGGCVVDCDASRIDAQLGPALARVREVLGQ